MIPPSNTLTYTDTLEGEEIPFGIGDERWVMRTQAELYSDVVTAIIREYSTNAYDAHVMAGHSDPIEVTLPSMMNPYFKVKDHGVGMSLELFRKVYTQFGVSDKRSSSKTNGMLGYGSKSGVAYTNTFTVTSVRDGIKTVGIVTRKPDWSIVLKVVATVKTDEPNGTEIVIPVHNWEEFCHKANEFYKFWLPGRVLVNGKEPVHNVGKKITDNLYYSNDWSKSYIVMGNVAYRIENPSALFRDARMAQVNFVAYVDDLTGEGGEAAVEFTPSREDLKYSELTKRTLARVIRDFEDQIVAAAEADIAEADNHFDAFLRWSEWTSKLGSSLFSDFSFNGDAFEANFRINASRYQVNGYGNSVQRISDWPVQNMNRTIIVTEYTNTLSSVHKSKAREYSSLHSMNSAWFLFTAQSEVDNVWVDQSRVISWDDLKAALPKKPKEARTYVGGRLRGSFDYYTRSETFFEQEVPANKELYFITVQESKVYKAKNILKAMDSDGACVLLSQNRVEKFKRDNPTVKNLIEHGKSLVIKDGPSLLTDECKRGLAMGHYTRQWVSLLTDVDDPKWAEYREAMKNADKDMEAYDNNLALAKTVGMGYTVKQAPRGDDESLLDGYPLLREIPAYTRNKAHVTLYINAVYAARKDNA